MFTEVKNTIMLQVMQNQDNPNELFKKWNTKNLSNVKCSKMDCDNISDDKAYIATQLDFTNKKFIIPLCQECYELQQIHYSSSHLDINDLGTLIKISKDVLLKYE